MSTTPTSIDPEHAPSDEAIASIEAAWKLPAVEPTRPAIARSRRAATVARASDLGYSSRDLLTLVLFVVLVASLVAMVANELVA